VNYNLKLNKMEIEKIREDVISLITLFENLEDDPKVGLLGMYYINKVIDNLILVNGRMELDGVGLSNKESIELIDGYNEMEYTMKLVSLLEILNELVIHLLNYKGILYYNNLIDAKIWLLKEIKTQQS